MPRKYKSLADYFDQTGKTHQELADELGVTRPCVSQWVNKKREPLPLRVTAQVIRLTGVPLEGLAKDGDAA